MLLHNWLLTRTYSDRVPDVMGVERRSHRTAYSCTDTLVPPRLERFHEGAYGVGAGLE